MSNQEITESYVAALWNENAELWSAMVHKGYDGYREYFNTPAMMEFIGDVRGKKLIDVGCGEGINTRLLARKGACMTGVDISSKLIKIAKRYEGENPLGIQYDVASFSDLTLYEESSFDRAVSFMSFMDSPKFECVAKEMFRLLRPSGDLTFSILHPCFVTKGFGWLKDDHGQCHQLTVSEYYEKNPWLETWSFKNDDFKDAKPFTSAYFPMTLSFLINTLTKAGFIIARMKEPQPSRVMCEKHPWLERWRKHASLFLYIQAIKPRYRVMPS